MALANTLVMQEGKRSEEVGGCGEHADQRHVMAHADVISHSGLDREGTLAHRVVAASRSVRPVLQER